MRDWDLKDEIHGLKATVKRLTEEKAAIQRRYDVVARELTRTRVENHKLWKRVRETTPLGKAEKVWKDTGYLSPQLLQRTLGMTYTEAVDTVKLLRARVVWSFKHAHVGECVDM